MTVRAKSALTTPVSKATLMGLMTDVTPTENKVYQFAGTEEYYAAKTLPGHTTVDGDYSTGFIPGAQYSQDEIDRLYPAARIDKIVVKATGAAPTALPAAGGTILKVTGLNLTGVTAFTFGGTAAALITTVSENEIDVTTPAKTAGSYTIAVTDDAGTLDPDSISLTNAVTFV